MFSSTLAFCKHFVTRRHFRLMCYGIAQNNKLSVPRSVFDLGGDPKNNIDHTRMGVSFATKYLNELENPKDIKWDDLTKQLTDMDVKNPVTKIFQACIRLSKLDMGVDYYNYLKQKGIQLSALDLMFFSKLLIVRKSEIKKHEELLTNLYFELKDFLLSSTLIREFVMEVFVEIPTCFSDIVKDKSKSEINAGNLPVIIKALELGMPDIALKFINDLDFTADTKFIDAYIDFCIRQAEKGKFSIEHVNKLISLCEEKPVPLNHENLLALLMRFVESLNKYQNDYNWSVSECEINTDNACSHCGLTLLQKGITNAEFQRLKEHFLKEAFIENNIFLHSTKTELRRFLKFLKSSPPYNLVIDGLNLLYSNKSRGVKENRHLKYFLDKGFKVLTIGRYHSKSHLTKGNFLNQQKYKKNAHFFFTSNTSDDDLFLLYAALSGGPKTFFVTGDYLNTYLARVDVDMKSIFLKWQITHQYLITPDQNLSPPLPHCGLPQLTLNTAEKQIWHLSQQNCRKIRITFSYPLNWFCLKAEKKEL